jgi:hypothetical protein
MDNAVVSPTVTEDRLQRWRMVYGPPTSRAGLRTNALPVAIRAVIVEHLSEYMKDGPDA